jgi:hypothetical protein
MNCRTRSPRFRTSNRRKATGGRQKPTLHQPQACTATVCTVEILSDVVVFGEAVISSTTNLPSSGLSLVTDMDPLVMFDCFLSHLGVLMMVHQEDIMMSRKVVLCVYCTLV